MFAWPWPWFTPEQAAEYLSSVGVDPEFATQPETFHCELCLADLGDKAYVVLDPPAGLVIPRKYHLDCLIEHMETHMEDHMDDIMNYISRKPFIP